MMVSGTVGAFFEATPEKCVFYFYEILVTLHHCTSGGGSGPYESRACVEICRLLIEAKADMDRVPGG
jgi:hypothetical protein